MPSPIRNERLVGRAICNDHAHACKPGRQAANNVSVMLKADRDIRTYSPQMTNQGKHHPCNRYRTTGARCAAEENVSLVIKYGSAAEEEDMMRIVTLAG